MTDQSTGSSRWKLIGVIVVFAAGSLGYRLLHSHHLQQTSALFIGLPAALALLLALTGPAKSTTGIILKGMTILLLLSGILLGEGFICIVMAAPLFYLVGFLIGQIVDRMQKREGSRLKLFPLILLPFLPLSVEGVRPSLSFARDEVIEVERVIPVTVEAVERSLSSRPDFEKPLPPFLRLRFPRPEATWGEGLEPGAYRAVRFTRDDEPPGILVVRVSERSPGSVRFETESDTTMIAQWLDWKSCEVHWESLEGGATRVRWTLRYQRRLDPAWYFGPWERYGVRLAASYMIDATTPGEGVLP
jgi:hypothetical protein